MGSIVLLTFKTLRISTPYTGHPACKTAYMPALYMYKSFSIYTCLPRLTTAALLMTENYIFINDFILISGSNFRIGLVWNKIEIGPWCCPNNSNMIHTKWWQASDENSDDGSLRLTLRTTLLKKKDCYSKKDIIQPLLLWSWILARLLIGSSQEFLSQFIDKTSHSLLRSGSESASWSWDCTFKMKVSPSVCLLRQLWSLTKGIWMRFCGPHRTIC